MSSMRLMPIVGAFKGAPKKHGGFGAGKCGPACQYLSFRTGHGDFECKLFGVRLTGIPAARNIECLRAEERAGEKGGAK